MTIKKVVFKDFDLGLSDDNRGPAGSFSQGRQIDSRSLPGELIPSRALNKESGSTVITEVHDMVRVDPLSTIFMAGGPEIYKRTYGGVYSVHTSDAAVVGVRDLDYNPSLDKVFAYDETEIHELYNVSNIPSGTEAWDYSKYTHYLVINQNNGTTTNAYTLLTSVTEGAANVITFTCTAEPLYSVTFNVDAKGASGDWVVTIHDGANRTVATATITFANVPAAGNDIEFIFSSPVRLKIGAEYHVHLHATAGTHAVHTATASDLSTADASTKASRLVNTGNFGHFTMQFGPKTLFCNEHYVGEWEIIDTSDNATAGFDPHRLELPSECVGIGMAIYNQYVVIACGINRSSDSVADERLTDGIIFFWDGVSPNYEFAVDVPQGAPFGLFAQNNILTWTAQGQLYRWAGGDIELAYEFPGQKYFSAAAGGPTEEYYLRGARRCITNWGNAIKIGYPHTTANTQLEIGVYSYGKAKSHMPQTINFDNIISTDNFTVQFNTATDPDTPITGITCVKRFGTNLLVAWKDYINGAVTYGVDIYVINGGPAAPSTFGPTCRWLCPIIDDERPGFKKTAMRLIVEGKFGFTGNAISPIIEYDDGLSTVSGEENIGSVDDDTYTLASMEVHQRFRSCRVGFEIKAAYTGGSLASFPSVQSLTFEYDDNTEEEDTEEQLDAS